MKPSPLLSKIIISITLLLFGIEIEYYIGVSAFGAYHIGQSSMPYSILFWTVPLITLAIMWGIWFAQRWAIIAAMVSSILALLANSMVLLDYRDFGFGAELEWVLLYLVVTIVLSALSIWCAIQLWKARH